MEEKTLDCWEDFEEELQSLDSLRQQKKDELSLHISDFLYRGHSDSSWGLETTLERFVRKPISLKKYYRLAFAAKPRVETFTEKHWGVPSPSEFGEWLEKQDHLFFANFPAYEYFAFLRHHGYPSPLLDWTFSPYIAAYFAMKNVLGKASHVSVYAYLERPGGVKSTSSDKPVIHSMGPYVTAHKRHFLQQSNYTICTRIEADDIYYSCHEDVTGRKDGKQDLLWKFNIPSTERHKALMKLHKMNISAFSLFETEDSLMETLSISEILFRENVP